MDQREGADRRVVPVDVVMMVAVMLLLVAAETLFVQPARTSAVLVAGS